MALDLDGSSTISYGDLAAVDFAANSAFALSAWLNIDSFAGAELVFATKGFSGSNTAYALQITGTTFLKIGSYNGSVHEAKVAHGWSTGTWHHAYGHYDGSQWQIYNDGAFGATGVDATGPFDESQRFSIGSIWNQGAGAYQQFVDGRIAEVAAWSRALGVGEIAALAAGYSAAFFCNGLKFYTPLVRNTGDISGGALVADTVGSPVAAAHPRIIMPGRQSPRRLTTAAAAAASGGKKLIGGSLILG